MTLITEIDNDNGNFALGTGARDLTASQPGSFPLGQYLSFLAPPFSGTGALVPLFPLVTTE